MSNKWTPINMPTDQVDAVKAIVKDNPHLGYRSPGDFYRDAAREKLQDLYGTLQSSY